MGDAKNSNGDCRGSQRDQQKNKRAKETGKMAFLQRLSVSQMTFFEKQKHCSRVGCRHVASSHHLDAATATATATTLQDAGCFV